MKVLLVDPFYNPKIVPPNYSLGEIERELRTIDIEVKVVDFIDESCEGQKLSYFLKSEALFIKNVVECANQVDAVYITSSYGIPLKQMPVFPRIRSIAKAIKKHHPDIDVYVGGSNVNYAVKMIKASPDDCFDKQLFDEVILGDELNFIKKFKEKNGIKSKSTDKGGLIEWKAWDIDKYPNYLSVLSAKGCVFNCSFCFESHIFEKAYEREGIESVVDNIEFASRSLGIKRFAIEDSTFFSNPDVETFCDEVIKRKLKIKWSAYSHINQIMRHKKLLPKLQRSGCTNIIMGIESHKDVVLKTVGKNITSLDSVKATNILKKYNIEVQGCLFLDFRVTLTRILKTLLILD